jgi:DNA-binding response OmpR family regulator
MNGAVNHILLVEDDSNLSDAITRYLGSEGFSVDSAVTLAGARAVLQARTPDAIVLDWMLPDGQGIDLLKELDRRDRTIPAILLTSRTDLVDKIVGLESGASDYMTKPFEARELGARIRVQLRKLAKRVGLPDEAASAPSVVSYAGIRMDLASRDVTYEAKLVPLAKLEFDLLKVLLENPNRVFPREALLNKVWGYENYPTTRTVDNHVVALRQKFDAALIETIRGVGYRLRDTKK